MPADFLPGLPVGIADFQSLRSSGKIYVDKTDLIYEIAKEPFSYFFFTRPRRFGKSLLLTTFQSLFQNGTEYFEGLKIAALWKDRTYRTVRLDFSELDPKPVSDFPSALCKFVLEQFRPLGFSANTEDPDTFFPAFSSWLNEQKQDPLVLLIDEYDAPITRCIGEEAHLNGTADCLSRFYAVLKSRSGSLRFLFITGITRFRQTTLFSGLNCLQDISRDSKYAALLGFSEEEIGRCFSGHIRKASAELNLPDKTVREQLRKYYSGYCFDEEGLIRVYVPWSVLNFLQSPQRGFRNYWYESGGQSSVLCEFLKKRSLRDPARCEENAVIELDELNSPLSADSVNDLVLLLQAGYLTIKSVDYPDAILGYPNEEVRQSMAVLFMQVLLNKRTIADLGIRSLLGRLKRHETEIFVSDLNRVLLEIAYDGNPLRNEAAVRTIVQIILRVQGADVTVEKHTLKGRCGLFVETGENAWIIELRFARKASEVPMLLKDAADQIRTRRCGEEIEEGKRHRLALVFSAEEGQFSAWQEV
jgi:hypothetical protein